MISVRGSDPLEVIEAEGLPGLPVPQGAISQRLLRDLDLKWLPLLQKSEISACVSWFYS
jgi:hypothetical protein